MDLFPTFASICSAKIPTDRKLDGKDISPVLFGKGDQNGHDVFHYYLGFNLQAVRSGPWKLHLSKDELYNLESDIGETENVAKDHSEIVSKLKQYAEEMRADLGDKTAEAPGVRTLGRVSDPLPLISSDGVVRPGFDRLFKTLP